MRVINPSTPADSASASRRTWSVPQAIVYLTVIAGCCTLAAMNTDRVPVWGGCALLAAYGLVVLTRSLAVLAGLLLHDVERAESAAQPPPDDAWPLYTVLLPVYREAGMLPGLVQAMAALDYPRDRLEVILLVETDDDATRAAAMRLDAPGWRVLLVPPGEPRTKPRACNVGLAEARGTFLVVFDAEDRPEPGQLKLAVQAFRRLPDSVACLQARLNFYNSSDNLLTRCFALEYMAWFDLYLPGLHSLRGVIPLGGTSNHFRTATLRSLHGWDPWNVTEDCELGVRLARAGQETRILDSTTWEEAVSQFQPWLRQRSRWVKGYWQTHLVHTRAPLDAILHLGLWRTMLMLFTVGGQVAVLLANPVCWIMLACWLWHPWPLHDPTRPLTRALLVGSVGLGLSNVLFIVMHALAALRRRRVDLLPVALLMPFYWVMISLGAWRGVLQSFFAPFRWEKTPHGLSATNAPVAEEGAQEPGFRVQGSGEEPAASSPLLGTKNEEPSTSPLNPELRTLAPAPRHRRQRWTSTLAILTVIAGIAVVAGPLARWLVILFGAIPLSGPGAQDEQTVEACWIGRREAVLTVQVDPGPSPAPRLLPLHQLPLTAVVFAKVDDGSYFETRIRHLACPLNGGPTNLTVVASLDRGWQTPAAGTAWGPWSLRRVRTLGVRLYGPEGPPRLARILRVETRGEVTPPALSVAVRHAPAMGEVWRVWQADFALSREYPNPFDPDQIDVWGVFTSATGAVVRVPAFYLCDYARTGNGPAEELAPAGTPHWAVRFQPPSAGLWQWRIEGSDHASNRAVTANQPIRIAAATTPGPVRVEPGQPWFSRANGSFFYPLTLNIRSPFDVYTDEQGWPLYTPHAPDPNGGALVMEEYLRRMQAGGITLGRIWTSPWFGGLEWTARWHGYHGLGHYNLQNAWRIDSILATAEARGVTVELALQPHGPFTRSYDVQWQDNPYNRDNGGPLDDPSEILTNPDARRWMRNRLRYEVARWGASPALFGWLLWIEMNTVNDNDADVLSWHREMSDYMHQLDCGAHPITTEFQGPYFCLPVWSLPGIDYIQCPSYNFGRGLINSFDESYGPFADIPKPFYIEEYGGSYQGGDPGWVAHEIHDGLWISWVKPYAGSPMAWWWNFIFGRHLERYYARFAQFVQHQDLRRHAWRYPAGSVTSQPWLHVQARVDDEQADLYLYGPATEIRFQRGGWERASYNWKRMAGSFNPLAADPGKLFDLPENTPLNLASLNLRDGAYRVEIWDTWSTTPPAVRTVTIRDHAGTLLLPALQRDAAVRIRPATQR